MMIGERFQVKRIPKLRMGLKLWSSNVDLVDEAKKLISDGVFDYIELTPVPGSDISPFVGLGLKFVIHVTHERFGFNIADPKKRDFNLKVLENCIDWADRLDAKHLIVHPGFGDIQNSLDLLSSVEDERILIENMPKDGLGGEVMVGYTPEDVRRLLGGRFGFCLDFGHAIKASHSIGVGYKKMLEAFMGLGPQHFHLHGGDSKKGMDEHLSLGEGDFDLKYIVSLLDADSTVTLETPRKTGLQEDRRNAAFLRDIIGRSSCL